MSILDQIRGSSMFPTLDLEVEVGDDMSSYLYRAVLIDSNLRTHTPDTTAIPSMVGVLQNAPSNGVARARCYGPSSIIFGENVASGDILKLSDAGGSEGKALVWVAGKDGHTHQYISPLPAFKGIVNVVDISSAPITGGTLSDFTFDFTYDTGTFTMSAASETISVTDLGGGDYGITFTPDDVNVGKLYRLKVDVTPAAHLDGGICTPQQFQHVPIGIYSVANTGTVRWILGQAFIGGPTDTSGLVLLRPQLF